MYFNGFRQKCHEMCHIKWEKLTNSLIYHLFHCLFSLSQFVSMNFFEKCIMFVVYLQTPVVALWFFFLFFSFWTYFIPETFKIQPIAKTKIWNNGKAMWVVDVWLMHTCISFEKLFISLLIGMPIRTMIFIKRYPEIYA